MPQTETASALSGFTDVINSVTSAVEPWQFLLAAAILLVLAIVLICALASRNRKFDDLLEEKEKQDYAAQRAEKEKEQLAKEKESSVRQVQAETERVVESKDQQLHEKDAKIAGLENQVDELTRFRDEYVQIPDARVEASRIIREAKDHAYVVSNRTEMEYAEIIEHANQEAESIRSLAQQRLTRSHETLKAALARANEIVEEAQLTASRLTKPGIAYMGAPNLIEAPAETVEAQGAQEETTDAEAAGEAAEA